MNITNRTRACHVIAGLVLCIRFAPGVGAQDEFEVVKPGQPEAEMRTWTSRSGSTVEAIFVRMEGDDVYLSKVDGTEFRIHSSKLSPVDIQYVEDLSAPPGIGQPAPAPATKKKRARALPAEPEPNDLPFFTSGPWQGQHAVYEHALFDAVMDRKGVIIIYPKDQGTRIAKPLRLSTRIVNTHPRRRAARITEYIEPGNPVMQPTSITLRGIATDREINETAEFEVTYSFAGNEITAWGYCTADGSKFKEKIEIAVRVPKSHDIEPEVEQPERIKIVEGHYLALTGGEGKDREVDYYSIPKMRANAKNAELIGPIWGPREISVTAPSSKAQLSPYAYPGKSLWEGFSLILAKEDPGSKSAAQKLILTIE